MNKLRLVALLGLTVAATYVVAEWSVLQKSGLHDLRAANAAVGGSFVGAGLFKPVPQEPERLALQAQVDRLERTFGQYREVKERQIADLLKLVANLERQIQMLTAQRAPIEQVAALRAASRPVQVETGGVSARYVSPAMVSMNLLRLAQEAGFTKVQVRP